MDDDRPEGSPRSREEIRVDLDSAQTAIDALNKRYQSFYEAVPEAERQVFRAAYGQIMEQVPIEEVVAQYGGDKDRLQEFVGLYGEWNQENQKLQAAQTEYQPHKVEDLTELIQDTSSRIDFQAILEHYHLPMTQQSIGYEAQDLHVLEKARRKAEEGSLKDLSFNDLDFIEGTLKEYRANWEGKGFIGNSNSEPLKNKDDQEEPADTQKIIETIRQTIDTLNRFEKLAFIYRPGIGYLNDKVAPLNYIARAVALSQRAEDPIQLDPRFVQAIDKFVAGKIQDYTDAGTLPQTEQQRIAYLESQIVVNPDEVYRNLQIEGLDDGDNITVPSVLKRDIKKVVPAAFLKGVTKIDFKDKPEGPSSLPGGETQGRSFSDYDPVTYRPISSRIEIYKSVKVIKDGDLVESVDSMVARRPAITEIVIHEIGHEVHARITYDEMEEWNVITEKGTDGLTWYTDQLKDDDHRRRREDFTESFKLFPMQPALLQVKSPERFEYMKKLYISRMTPEQAEQFMANIDKNIGDIRTQWQLLGITDEQVKAYPI